MVAVPPFLVSGTKAAGRAPVMAGASGQPAWTDVPTHYKAGPISVGPSDATEVTLVNQTIPAGLMGVYGMLRCTFGGSFINNSGVNRTYTLRVYAGGTKILDIASVAIATATMRRGMSCDLNFANRNVANSNRLFGLFGIGAAATPTTGMGSLSGSGAAGSVPNVIASDQQAIDTAVDWIFKVTLQLSAADAQLDMTVTQIRLEVMP